MLYVKFTEYVFSALFLLDFLKKLVLCIYLRNLYFRGVLNVKFKFGASLNFINICMNQWTVLV